MATKRANQCFCHVIPRMPFVSLRRCRASPRRLLFLIRMVCGGPGSRRRRDAQHGARVRGLGGAHRHRGVGARPLPSRPRERSEVRLRGRKRHSLGPSHARLELGVVGGRSTSATHALQRRDAYGQPVHLTSALRRPRLQGLPAPPPDRFDEHGERGKRMNADIFKGKWKTPSPTHHGQRRTRSSPRVRRPCLAAASASAPFAV
jgi:hypothetical protein